MIAAIDPRAIVFGAIVDQAITFAVPLALPGIQLEALAAAGAASTMIGGLVAGRLARSAGALQGACVGLVALAIGLLSGIAASAELPRWYLATAFVTVVPAGALGGFLARRKPFDARTGLV